MADAAQPRAGAGRFPIVAPPPLTPVTPGPVPTFSAIIPAYNAAGTIGEAVASALGQTVPPTEVIVVDDGSTDATAAALDPWLDRITIVRTENHGVSAARNEAARRATGDFIANLDADDVWAPERLEALGELAAARPDLDLLSSNVVYEQPGRKPRVFFHSGAPFPVGDQRAAILEWSFPQHAAVRRTAFWDVGGYDAKVRMAEDWDLWLRLIFAGSRGGLVDAPLLGYRQQPDGMTSDIPALIQGMVELHCRSLLRDDLTAPEVRVAQAALTRRLKTLELHTALQVTRRLEPGWRPRVWRVARTIDHPRSVRLKAALAASAPAFALRRLNRSGATADADVAA